MPQGTDSKLVKSAHKTIKYTKGEVKHLKECTNPKTGPMYFMRNFIYIHHPTRGRLLFDPYDYQLDLVENYHENRFSVNMCGRQMGKTTVAAGYLLWYAMFIPDSTILIAAHKYQGSAEIMQRVRYAYESVPDFIRPGVVNYNRNSIDFDNGSRIQSATTTENTGRGMSLSLIYCDEFAFVQPRVAQEFWTSLSPTLATGGKCIITSTPNSDDDQFATIWREANNTINEHGEHQKLGRNGFSGIKVTWSQHPERNEEWAKEERSRVGEERFRREHLCEFIARRATLETDALFASTMWTNLVVEVFEEIRDSGSGGAAHACELETSAYLYLDASRVQMEKAVDHYGGAAGKEGSAFTSVCLLYTSPSPRDATLSRMPSSA